MTTPNDKPAAGKLNPSEISPVGTAQAPTNNHGQNALNDSLVAKLGRAALNFFATGRFEDPQAK